MTSESIRALVRARLESGADRILLRVLLRGRENGLAELSGPDLYANSIEIARRYCQAPPSGVVLLLLPHSIELFLLHLGLVLLGRLPAILPWPTNRIDPEKYQRNILHQLGNLPAAQLLTLPRLARNLDPGLPFVVTDCAIHDHERHESLFSMDLDVNQIDKQDATQMNTGAPEESLFLQFSGGTTGDQKCIVVTAPMLSSQLEKLGKVLQFDEEDGVISWLPLYHDMGLIACFWLPLWHNVPSIQLAAEDWLMNPGMLFSLASKYRATFCWLPNFAFAYLAAQKKRIDEAASLTHVKAWINCSEPVRERSFDAFIEAYSKWGVRREQCQASYAMAENVFAVTQTPLNVIPTTFDRRSTKQSLSDLGRTSYILADEHFVSSGRNLPDTTVRIRDGNGQLCGDTEPGSIEIHGESLFCGYWSKGGFHTRSLTTDGWYLTGDYGFRHADDLYVIGRMKDVIISSGVNIFPEDIESLVQDIDGVYPGRVVAFGVEDQTRGTESVALVAEMRGDFNNSSAAALEQQIRKLVSAVFGFPLRYVRVTPERWIVKSTAGKISRRETRARFLEELSIVSDTHADLPDRKDS